jgi:PelA/Pel-15E family pectate lyase
MRRSSIHKTSIMRLAAKLLLPIMLLCVLSATGQDLVADNMLMFQRTIGGWSKHYQEKSVNYNREYSTVEKATILDEASRNDATIDNGATTKEIRYLVKTFKQTGKKEYLEAAERGIRYLLTAQYKNGGWPQYYPDKSGYRSEITYNDNAMVNVLLVLSDVAAGTNNLELVSKKLVKPSAKAVKKGIDCILKTQVTVNGKPTAWCAQHDAVTLKPAKARAFELISLSGAESVGIVDFLMKQPKPSVAIKNAVNNAVDWLSAAQIKGFKYADIIDSTQPKGIDRVLVPDANGVVWARFYDIETNEPFFCGRDGIKKKSLTEIEVERRTGYGWYGTWPKELLQKKYPAWKAANS